VKYYPDGTPVKGGAKEKVDSPVNMKAACTASPDDTRTPLVHGAQNVTGSSTAAPRVAPGYGLALFDPSSGMVASSEGSYQVGGAATEKPPTGTAGLGWLLNSPMTS